MSEPAGAAFGAGEFLHRANLLEGYLLEAGNDHLGDAFAVFDLERLVGEVNEQHLHLAAVVGVDGAGAVEHGDAVFEGEAAAGTDLRLAVLGQLDEEARGHQPALAGIQGHRLGEVGPQVEAGGHRRLVCRQRIIGCVEYLANGHRLTLSLILRSLAINESKL